MRIRHIIKFIASILIISFFAVMIPSVHSANFTISKSTITLNEGTTQTITINASTSTGRIDITSSNNSVASVDTSSIWVENNSKTIVISGKTAGTAKITISGELYDSQNDEEGTVTKTITVTVNKVVQNSTTSTDSNSSSNSSNSTNTGTTSNSNTGTTSSTSTGTTSKPSSSSSSSNTTNNKNSTNTATSAVGTQNNAEQIIEEQPQEENNTDLLEENTEITDVNDNEDSATEEIDLQNADNSIAELDNESSFTSSKSFIVYCVVALSLICIAIATAILRKIWKK